MTLKYRTPIKPNPDTGFMRDCYVIALEALRKIATEEGRNGQTDKEIAQAAVDEMYNLTLFYFDETH